MRVFLQIVVLVMMVFTGDARNIQDEDDLNTSLVQHVVVGGSFETWMDRFVDTDTIAVKRRSKKSDGTDKVEELGKIFGRIITFFGDEADKDRYELVVGKEAADQFRLYFRLNDIRVKDEGYFYWSVNSIHHPHYYLSGENCVVWVPPEEPTVTPMSSFAVEHVQSEIASCSSNKGKPAAELSWYNGTVKLPSTTEEVRNVSGLLDVRNNLKITPSRFDFNRTFTCKIDHKSYEVGKSKESKELQYRTLVKYQPVDVYIWANLTTKEVFCEGTSYPEPKFNWIYPTNMRVNDTKTLLLGNLYSLPGYGWFECFCFNGVGKVMKARVMVDDLLYPDGKPGFAGLDYIVWAYIGGGVLALIIIVVIVSCCCCRKKKKKKAPKMKNANNINAYSVDVSRYDYHSQPSIIEMNQYGGSRENEDDEDDVDETTPAFTPRSALKKTYSLERLVDEKYGPIGGSRGSYVDTSTPSSQHRQPGMNGRRPSREEIDQVASRIQQVSEGWSNLAKSRENLARSREHLAPSSGDSHEELPPRYQPHDENPQYRAPYTTPHPFGDRGFVSMQRLNDQEDDEEDEYPYMDDTADGASTTYQDDPRNSRSQNHGDHHRGYNGDRYHDDQRQYDHRDHHRSNDRLQQQPQYEQSPQEVPDQYEDSRYQEEEEDEFDSYDSEDYDRQRGFLKVDMI